MRDVTHLVTRRAAGRLALLALPVCLAPRLAIEPPRVAVARPVVTAPLDTPPPARPAAVVDRALLATAGAGVITSMHDRYSAGWFHTLTLVQTATITMSGFDVPETWYVAWSTPDRIRIDIGPASKGDGAIYTPDSVYDYTSGLQTRADTGVNAALVLGYDVYAEPVERTVAALARHGFTFTAMHDGVWDGHPAYVIGASNPADVASPQIWIDKSRLLVLRVIEPTVQGLTDTRYDQYVKSGGGWVATDVMQLLDGQPHLHETASDVKSNVALDPALFDPLAWRTAKLWHGGRPSRGRNQNSSNRGTRAGRD